MWFIGIIKPTTTATSDLDENQDCADVAFMRSAASTTSLTPPTSAAWKVGCSSEGGYYDMTLTFTPISRPPCTDAIGGPLDDGRDGLCLDGTSSCDGGSKEAPLQPGGGTSFYWRD